MLPSFKHTEFISKSGNTELIYIVHNKRKSPLEALAEKWERLSSRKKYIIKQKLLGACLIAVGIISMTIFTDDAMGGLIATGIGFLRIVCND